MRKHFVMTAVVSFAAFLAVFAGCSLARAAEKNVTVVLKSGGAYYGAYTVNSFNNALVTELPKAEDSDYVFLGWSPKDDYIAAVDDEGLLLPNKSLIRYADVKNYIEGANSRVTLYAVFGEKVQYDLVVGWYAKTATTGLTQDMMTAYTTALNTYLSAEGYTDLLIDIREYSATYDVATVGSEVNADGDVDIMIGMGSNITSTGNIQTLELESYTIGSKSRNIARLTDEETAVKVFTWMKTDEVRALFI